jgi:outer membrane protein OmpA-like peptidoglycan-associated protein
MKRSLLLLLVGWVGWQGPALAQIMTENPKVGYVQSSQTKLHKIEITDKFTIAHCSFLTKNWAHCLSPTFIFICTNTRLVDRKTGNAYQLVSAKDIPMLDPDDTTNFSGPLVRHRAVYCNQQVNYTLYFQKLEPGITEIDLVEPPQDGYESPFSFFKVQINNPEVKKETPKPAKPEQVVAAKPKTQPAPQDKASVDKKKPAGTDPAKPKPKPEPKPARPDSGKVAAARPNTSFSSQPLNEGQTIRLQNLTFAQGKYDILASSYAELDHLVALMEENPRLEILLEGHTDNIGSPVENMKLSQERVKAVKNYLTQKGIGAERIQTKAYGSTKPLVTSGTAQERTANRRVELKVLKK